MNPIKQVCIVNSHVYKALLLHTLMHDGVLPFLGGQGQILDTSFSTMGKKKKNMSLVQWGNKSKC